MERSEGITMTAPLDLFYRALMDVDHQEARRLVLELSRGMGGQVVVEEIIAPALNRMGHAWDQGESALSQVYMSGRICAELILELLPGNNLATPFSHPPMAIAVLEDCHMLGKRVVSSVLRANGFYLRDYGRLTVEEAVRKVRQDEIRVLLLSTLMLNSALRVKELVRELRSASLNVKIIVGGAPYNFDEHLWKEVGADAMGRSSADATEILRRMLEAGL